MSVGEKCLFSSIKRFIIGSHFLARDQVDHPLARAACEVQPNEAHDNGIIDVNSLLLQCKCRGWCEVLLTPYAGLLVLPSSSKIASTYPRFFPFDCLSLTTVVNCKLQSSPRVQLTVPEMAASSMPSTLPEVLFDGWRLRKHDISEAQKHGGLKEWTVSSLCSEYLQYQLQRHEREVAAKAQACPSLALLSIGRIVETLRSSTSLPADSKAVAEDLPSTTLHRIIQDPRTPYIVLRAFDSLTSTTIRGSNGDRKIVDIDEAVLAAERYVRSSQIKPSDGYLVTLGDLSRMFGPADAAGLITLKRKSPPKGGFEFLHQKRKKTVLIQGTDACFVKTFDRVTQDALKGLDWSHVFVAGGMVLNTLLHIDDLSKDIHGDIKDCDIDLYLYDLNPEEATRKVEEIYKVWSTNVLDHDSSSNIPPARHMVVKNAKTINFIPEYPGRRVQIILKLLPSPLDVLLNFDLDVCALGFDGSRVLMLPRCARAIETGYSTFTMDLIWGHHLGNRRETQEIRVFKYADRGFGLRILPSYVRSLGEDKFGDTASLQQAHPLVGTRDDEVERDRNGPTRVFEGETGLKSLRRISYLARKFVHRCYFGPFKVLDHTERARQHRLTYEDGWNDDMSDEDFDEDVSDEDEDEDVSEEDETDDEMLSEEASDGEEGEENVSPEEQAAEQAIGKTGFLGPWDHQSEDQPCTDPCSNADENPVDGLESCPIIRLCAMDGFSTHEGLPDGPRSLAVFEVLMRHCEAWRLDAVGLAR